MERGEPQPPPVVSESKRDRKDLNEINVNIKSKQKSKGLISFRHGMAHRWICLWMWTCLLDVNVFVGVFVLFYLKICIFFLYLKPVSIKRNMTHDMGMLFVGLSVLCSVYIIM